MGGKRSLSLLVAVLLLSAGIGVVLRWINSPVRPDRSAPSDRPRPPAAAAPPASRSRAAAASPAAPVGSANSDPDLPRYVGGTRRIAAGAIDAIAKAPLDVAMVSLARRFLAGSTAGSWQGRSVSAPLQLDLTRFDDLRFVEQLLALANSRQVRTKTEGVDRFSDHVRQLRYAGGRVDPCRYLEQRSLWALAAQRRGYLVDLTPFLPGVQQRSLPLAALFHPAASGARSRAGQPCPLPPGSPGRIPLVTIPPAALPAVLPSLRSGDLFVLVHRSPERQDGRIGIVERGMPGRPLASDGSQSRRDGGPVGGILVRPGQGVIRSADLQRLVRETPGTVGVSFLRPIPNADGRLDR